MSAWPVNDDRQIVAEARNNLYFLPQFNSKTTGPNFTKLLLDVEVDVDVEALV